MDLRQHKPVHMKCPKCGYDFSTNTNKIVQELQIQKERINRIRAAITEAKKNNVSKNAPQYKRLLAQQADCLQVLSALKRLNRNLTENAELEKYKVFYRLVKHELGEEKTLKLIKEAEDCLVYNDYDMAIQRHTNFDNA